jgi:predicted nucleic acid-binding Zn ribbon protein
VAAIFVGSSSGNKKDKSKKKKMSKVTLFLLLVVVGAWLEVNEAAGSSYSSCPVWADLDEAVSTYVKELFGNSVVGGECDILMKNRRRR